MTLRRFAACTGAILSLAACQPSSPPQAPTAAAATSPAANGPVTPRAARARPKCAERFAQFDINHDERVSLEEFRAQPHARPDPEGVFKARDGDSDGALSAAEFCTGHAPVQSTNGGHGMGPRHRMQSKSSHGTGAHHGMGPQHGVGGGAAGGEGCDACRGASCEPRFEQLDANADGALTEAELAAHPHRHATAAELLAARDANHDSKLTKEEFCAMKTMPSQTSRAQP
jgi:Ca2+-binding EF-hand superfamily protein